MFATIGLTRCGWCRSTDGASDGFDGLDLCG